MASSKLLPLRRFSKLLRTPSFPSSPSSRPQLLQASRCRCTRFAFRPSSAVSPPSRSFGSRTSTVDSSDLGPAAIDYRSLLQENEFHELADSTIHDLQDKLEEYGDTVQVDGFDIDYGNEVMTLELGELGTYVLNKQTPNRQLWLSSPVSGPSRFDWDRDAEAWIYQRTKASLARVFESELQQLCGEPIKLT
ncbi:Frataxin, mitochondrial [Linum grandiflorum]